MRGDGQLAKPAVSALALESPRRLPPRAILTFVPRGDLERRNRGRPVAGPEYVIDFGGLRSELFDRDADAAKPAGPRSATNSPSAHVALQCTLLEQTLSRQFMRAELVQENPIVDE
jgi:hypothetical protein